MKVLLISTGIIPVPCKYGAAIETHTYNLANSLAELGCTVHYVTDITSKAKLNKRVVVHEVHAPPMKFPLGFPWWIPSHLVGGLLAFRSALFVLIRERLSFDVIHVHEEVVGTLILLLKRSTKLNVPVLFTLHIPVARAYESKTPVDQRIRELIFQLTGKILIMSCDHLIALSTEIKKVVTQLGYPENKITVIPHGIDCNMFKPQISDIKKVRTKYHIDGMNCLFVGRLEKRKGADLLLEAFSCLSATDYKCVIVGDGPERNHLAKIAKDLRMDEKVILTGAVPLEDLPGLYSGAEVFVSPTYAEAASMAVLEALSSGLPVIASEIPGIRDVIIDGYNGLIFQRNSKELLACLELLTKDDALRRRMKGNARLTAIKKHDWRQIARRTIKAYEKAVRGFRS